MKTVHRTGLAWVSVVARVGSEPHAPLALLPGGGRCNAPRKARDYTGVLVSTYGFWQSLPRLVKSRPMSTVTMNISLSDELKAFVDARVQARGYGSTLAVGLFALSMVISAELSHSSALNTASMAGSGMELR